MSGCLRGFRIWFGDVSETRGRVADTSIGSVIADIICRANPGIRSWRRDRIGGCEGERKLYDRKPAAQA